MRARMTSSTRVLGDDPHNLYAGDLVEGTEAAVQVAAGNAEEIPEPVEEPKESKKSTEAPKKSSAKG